MTLAQFIARVRDDASRFRVQYERTQMQHPGFLEDERELNDWAGLFKLFMESEDVAGALKDARRR